MGFDPHIEKCWNRMEPSGAVLICIRSTTAAWMTWCKPGNMAGWEPPYVHGDVHGKII